MNNIWDKIPDTKARLNTLVGQAQQELNDCVGVPSQPAVHSTGDQENYASWVCKLPLERNVRIEWEWERFSDFVDNFPGLGSKSGLVPGPVIPQLQEPLRNDSRDGVVGGCSTRGGIGATARRSFEPYLIEVETHTLDDITYVIPDSPVFRAQTEADPCPARMDDLSSAISYSTWNQAIAATVRRYPGNNIHHINDYHGALVTEHTLSQLSHTIKMAPKSTEHERRLLRARSAIQHFPVVEWRQCTEDSHSCSIAAS